jgi:hypothetical protein
MLRPSRLPLKLVSFAVVEAAVGAAIHWIQRSLPACVRAPRRAYNDTRRLVSANDEPADHDIIFLPTS